MSGNSMRKYMDILNENAIIQTTAKSIKVDASVYELYRVLQAMADPDNYTQNSDIATSGIMLFNDEEEYKRATDTLKKMGIKYDDQGINNSHSAEDDAKNANNVSPYANNGQVKKKKIYR